MHLLDPHVSIIISNFEIVNNFVSKYDTIFIMDEFKDIFKRLRSERNISQRQAGTMLRESNKKISHWETGYSTPDLDAIRRIALVFGVSADYLLGLKDEDGEPIEDGEKEKK